MKDYTTFSDIVDSLSEMNDEELDNVRVFLNKNRYRARRRSLNVAKARRKRCISRAVYGFDWYKNLHQYSKNKVHCSCNLCRFRPVWDPDNMSIRDIRRTEIIWARLSDYYNTSE